MNARASLLPLLLFPLLVAFSLGQPISGTVTYVNDGDTAIIKTEKGGKFTCRLYGIDSPETAGHKKPGQKYGREAAVELRKLVLGKHVDIRLTGEKNYNRQVCLIRVEGMDVNLEMIRRGYAWAYRKHLKPPFKKKYIRAEEDAKSKRIGLWNDEKPIPPWRFKYLYW